MLSITKYCTSKIQTTKTAETLGISLLRKTVWMVGSRTRTFVLHQCVLEVRNELLDNQELIPHFYQVNFYLAIFMIFSIRESLVF